VTRIAAVEPIFAVSDMPRAAKHYERLGFEVSYHDEGYAFAQRQGLNLHLDLTDSPPPGGGLLVNVGDCCAPPVLVSANNAVADPARAVTEYDPPVPLARMPRVA
jgi:hypothetical protein